MKPKMMVLVPAAGTGTRFGDALPKQYLDICGRPLIFHTLLALTKVSRIDGITVVLSPDDSHWQNYQSHWQVLGAKISTALVTGLDSRAHERRDSGGDAGPPREGSTLQVDLHGMSSAYGSRASRPSCSRSAQGVKVDVHERK